MYRAYLRELVNYKNVATEDVERSLTISPQSFDSVASEGGPTGTGNDENTAPGCDLQAKWMHNHSPFVYITLPSPTEINKSQFT
ncbi:hypothetical protein RRG08_029602 [Elysia crispata]|uniref:Uncharacterized protein n=1 Tax=Elysia crispata TaxID=231223 RepID=A0AAE0XPB4_9GAST|nr:hypothetical protein RRG08_029602 [Elysia crispata]